MRTIIDLSEFNNVTSWELLSKVPELVVIIRCGRRDSRSGLIIVDQMYRHHRQMCEKYGIPFSVYFFSEAITVEEAKEEALFTAFTLRDVKSFPVPVFVDCERIDGKGRADGLDKAMRTLIIQTFCRTLQSMNIPAGYYTNLDWYQNQLQPELLPFSLWFAQWGVSAPSVPDHTLWQYTATGSIPGIKGYVDISHDKSVVAENPADKVIKIALEQEGYIEKATGDLRYLYDKTANPGYGNYTKYGYEMHQIQPSNMDYPAAHCDAFVDWCFKTAYGVEKAKQLLCGDFDDYTVNSANLYKKAGRWFTSPKYGDQIFFKNRSGICHTGLVVKVEGGYVYTIEGNTSVAGVKCYGGRVCRKSYTIGDTSIAGYGRPDYNKILK